MKLRKKAAQVVMKRVNEREHNGEVIYDEVAEEQPKPFIDWQARASRVSDVVLMVVAALAVVSSAWAIGDLAVLLGWPGWISWPGAAIIDLFWIACHIKAWSLRYDEDAAAPALKTGALLLKASVVANAAHAFVMLFGGRPGWQVAMACVVMAALPVAGKVAMKLTMPDHPVNLNSDDLKALQAKRARLHSQIATAEMRLDLVRAEKRIARLTGTDACADDKPDAPGRTDAQVGPVRTQVGRPEPAPALTGQDARTDTPDPLAELVAAASGPSEILRTLAGHGVQASDLVDTALRLRPDQKRDSLRRTLGKLQDSGTGQYL